MFTSAQNVTDNAVFQQQAATLLEKRCVIIPDFPKVGHRYLDFYLTFDQNPDVREAVVNCFAKRYSNTPLDGIAAIGNGGFSLGACLAFALSLPLIPIRKANDTVFNSYTAEVGMVYAKRELTLSKDIPLTNKRILLLDDTIASGGTFSGAIKLLKEAGAKVVEIATVFETTSKDGRSAVSPVNVFSIIAKENF